MAQLRKTKPQAATSSWQYRQWVDEWIISQQTQPMGCLPIHYETLYHLYEQLANAWSQECEQAGKSLGNKKPL